MCALLPEAKINNLIGVLNVSSKYNYNILDVTQKLNRLRESVNYKFNAEY
jgi:hypothetical protein